LAYQARWIGDLSKFKIYDKTRQAGITFAETLDIVMRLSAAPTSWYYLSVSESRVQEAIEYANLHCLALGVAVERVEGWLKFEEIKFKHLTLEFPNGSRLIGLPANPRTARGVSGPLTLDEFAHHQQADAIWKAAQPIITWGYPLRVISTPDGKTGKFYDIWTHNQKYDADFIESELRSGNQPIADMWSRHFTDIYQAAEDGHPVNIDECKEAAGTSDVFEQEYLGRFIDDSSTWLPYSLIDSRIADRASVIFDSSIPPSGPLYLGNDIGRNSDLTVYWINERRPSGLRTTRGVVTLHKAPFDVQEETLDGLMLSCRRAAIDAQGIGQSVAEDAAKRHGESRIDQVKMVGNTPAMLAKSLKQELEAGRYELPADAATRLDLHSVQRLITKHGNVSFKAPRTKDGHADRFWAAALALHAEGGGMSTAADFEVAERSRYDQTDLEQDQYY